MESLPSEDTQYYSVYLWDCTLGKDYQLQRQPAATAGSTKGSWQRGHWRSLSPLVGPVAAPMEWVEPLLVG
jgi:hypothetical protein